MSAPTERDADELLRALGELQRARTETLVRAESDAALHDGELGPLSDAETSALIAATQRRLALPSHPRRGRRFGLFAATALAAAALAVLFTSTREIRESAPPEYVLLSPNSDSALRGGEPGPAGARPSPSVYTIGRQLRFLLRPPRATTAVTRVGLFSEQEGRVRRIEAVEIQRTEGGSVVVTLTTGGAGYQPTPGSDTLVFELGAQQIRLPVVWRPARTDSP